MSGTKNGADVEKAIDAAAEAVAVEIGKIQALEKGVPKGDPLGMDGLLGVPVRVTVEIGRTKMTLAELVALTPGSVVTLDREAHEPVDVLVNGKIVARGEVVSVDDQYGVRVTSVA